MTSVPYFTKKSACPRQKCNDINLSKSMDGGREFFDILEEKIKTPKIVRKKHFNNVNKAKHYEYGKQYMEHLPSKTIYTAQPRLSCWIWNSLWYNPFFFINSSCVPCSTSLPLSRTRIWSASTTVRSRWAIIMTVLPSTSFEPASIQCLSPTKKHKLYKSSINKSIHFVQRSLSSSTRG